jgi:hypothetical protein
VLQQGIGTEPGWDLPRTFSASAALVLAVLLAALGLFTDYSVLQANDKHVDQYYMYYIHVAMMVFVGFGFLMTFLHRYSYSAVGLNFFASSVVMLEFIVVGGAVQQVRWACLLTGCWLWQHSWAPLPWIHGKAHLPCASLVPTHTCCTSNAACRCSNVAEYTSAKNRAVLLACTPFGLTHHLHGCSTLPTTLAWSSPTQCPCTLQLIFSEGGNKVMVGLPLLIDAEFAAAAAMISFGAVLGKTSPTQLLWLLVLQVPVYAFNAHLVRPAGQHYRVRNVPCRLQHLVGPGSQVHVTCGLGPPTVIAWKDHFAWVAQCRVFLMQTTGNTRHTT